MAPALLATAWPAGVLPVRVTALTKGCSITASTWALPIRSVSKRCSGNPVRRKTSAIARAQPGTFEQARLSPAQEGVMGLGNGTCHLRWCHLRVGIDGFPRRGVDGLYGHGGPPTRVLCGALLMACVGACDGSPQPHHGWATP